MVVDRGVAGRGWTIEAPRRERRVIFAWEISNGEWSKGRKGWISTSWGGRGSGGGGGSFLRLWL